MRRSRWALAWLGCTLVTFGLFAEPKATPIHPDEVYWIGSTYYYHLAFERGDWSHADWMLQPARENPPVAKYVIGLGLALQGQHVVNRDMLGCFHLMFIAPGAWGEGEDYAKRVAVVGAMNATTCGRVQGGPGVTKPRALPYLARYVILVCAALTSLVLFFVGASVSKPATGLVASQLLLLHPHMIHAYNRTMSDPIMLLFSVAAAFAIWKCLSAPGPRRSAIIGVLLALACGAKMNGLIVVFLFGAAVVVTAWQARQEGNAATAARALAFGGVTLALALIAFVVINPAILSDVWSGLVAVVVEAQRNTAIQARVMFQLHLTTFAEKFAAMSMVAGGPVLFVIAAFGVLFGCYKARRAGLWFVAGWWAIAVVCVTAWIPFDWTRYMLPILPPFALLAAHAIVAAAQTLNARLQNARLQNAPGKVVVP